MGRFLHHRIKHAVQVLGHTFARAVRHEVGLPNRRPTDSRKLFDQGIVRTENACVIEVLVDPSLEVLELPEIDHEPVVIRGVAPKYDSDAPIVTVDKRAMAIVPVLPMGPWNIQVGLATGKYIHAGILQFSRTITSIDGAPEA